MKEWSGFLFSFEGPDCSGKSTQVHLLTQFLTQQGWRVTQTREPGGTKIGEEIRTLVKHIEEEDAPLPETELFLFSASRAQLVRKIIMPALEQGHIVLADRFLDSTTVYQGFAHQIDLQMVFAIHQIAVGDCIPHRTFLLDLPVEEARNRNRLRKSLQEANDRFELRELEFHQKVRDGYRVLAEMFPERFFVLDATQSVDNLHHLIREEVLRVLRKN